MLSLTYYAQSDSKNTKKKDRITTNKTDNNVVVEVKNVNNRQTIILKALTDIVIHQAELKLDIDFSNNSKFFLNGYQSWTDTKEAYIDEYEKIARRAKVYFKKNRENETYKKTADILVNIFAFERYGDVLFYDYDKNKLHGYDVFYIKGEKEFFSFNYNYKNSYLVYEIHRKEKEIRLVSDCRKKLIKAGEEFIVFDYGYYDNYNKGLESFYELFKEKEDKKIFGYTSWYNYYQDINEDIILRDLDALDSRFNLFQIDDGFETFVGDWLDVDKKKFPNGLKGIVDKIHNKGYKAGIWLAPFVAEEKSKLYTEHKELFKKDKLGNCIKCGGNWSGFYVLDIDNEDAKEYIKKCLNYYVDLGFDFFKLDFLYSVSLPRYYDETRAIVTDKSYKFIRDILKDKIILGCGALPFASADYFDYLRIGPDVSLEFDDVWFMRKTHRERISTKTTLQNTIYRSIFNRHLFYNDPDVFLLRSENIKLSVEQKRALLTINSLFGNVLMTSDNIATYNDEQKKMLDDAFNMFYNAKNICFERIKNMIKLSYELDGKSIKLIYDTKKGVLYNG
ncbi:MAG: alpha-galactosidase [Acholeplasmatales bacterium]|nr:alpha-galactosidase [Acholeplasmatales bacterium]